MVYVNVWTSAEEHCEYVSGRKLFPGLKGPKSAVGIQYAELIELQGWQQQQQCQAKPSWILTVTWTLIRSHQAVQSGEVGVLEKRGRLKRVIRQMLKQDRMQ